jgi:hypothetical protein
LPVAGLALSAFAFEQRLCGRVALLGFVGLLFALALPGGLLALFPALVTRPLLARLLSQALRRFAQGLGGLLLSFAGRVRVALAQSLLGLFLRRAGAGHRLLRLTVRPGLIGLLLGLLGAFARLLLVLFQSLGVLRATLGGVIGSLLLLFGELLELIGELLLGLLLLALFLRLFEQFGREAPAPFGVACGDRVIGIKIEDASERGGGGEELARLPLEGVGGRGRLRAWLSAGLRGVIRGGGLRGRVESRLPDPEPGERAHVRVAAREVRVRVRGNGRIPSARVGPGVALEHPGTSDGF